MTYVADHTPAELRAHMRRVITMPGWNDPLVERLYKEILALDEQIAAWDRPQDDAARYRFLRDYLDMSPRDVFGSWCEQLNNGLDAAIDAAMGEKK